MIDPREATIVRIRAEIDQLDAELADPTSTRTTERRFELLTIIRDLRADLEALL